MSAPPIARNADLSRLESEGYALEVDHRGYLLVRDVPYVTTSRTVKRGTLVGTLVTQGTIEDIVGFNAHTMHFVGEVPCDFNGEPLTRIINNSHHEQLAPGLWVDHYFSSKPGPEGYPSMYAQVTQYVTILESHARRVEPDVTAKIGPVVPSDPEDQGPHVYTDTASSRAGILMVAAKLSSLRVAIVGVGGTGSYVLDQVVKTLVAEIHLFDDDIFRTHNAFRAPGAATVEHLRAKPLKVDYWVARYSAMHRSVIAHPYRVTAANAEELTGFDFVFLCMDSGPDKLAIVEALEAAEVPFVDAGIGVQEIDGKLRGVVRATTSTPSKRDHVRRRVSFEPPRGEDDYERNIQVSELNALNALLAVFKWKKYFGFYHDFEHEHDTTYTIDTHFLTRDEHHEPPDADAA